MAVKTLAVGIGDADELALATRAIDLIKNGQPHLPTCRVNGSSRFSLDSHNCANGGTWRSPISAEQNDCRCAMTRYVRPSCVNNVCQVPSWDVVLNEFLSELPLRE